VPKEQNRNVALGILAMLSGDPVLAPVGKTLASRGSKLQSMGQGFLLDPESGQVSQSSEYADWIKEREAVTDDRWADRNEAILDRMVAGNEMRQRNPQYRTTPTEGGQAVVQINPHAEGGAGVRNTIPVTAPLAESDRQRASEAERLVSEAHSLYGDLDKQPEAVSRTTDIPVSILRRFDVTRPLGNLLEEGSYSPAEMTIRTRGARLESDLSKLAAGLSLTGFELGERERWSPFAPGITRQESQRRLHNVEQVFGGMRDTIVRAPAIGSGRTRRYNPATGGLE
jgi:hypothetical protein